MTTSVGDVTRQLLPRLRSESGEVLPGREDDWTLLLFHDGVNAVDATGSRLWGAAVCYEPIRRPLRERDLRRLLERLASSDDDTFRLLSTTSRCTSRARETSSS